MTPRLTSAMLVSSLVRRVGQAGGNAAILARGDAERGAILLICAEKGVLQSIRERVLDIEGIYRWQPVGPQSSDSHSAWLERRRSRDPDLWIVELDIANAERFADETSLTG
ncbi:MAG: DUF1491 family protein [Sphingomonadaceae bacterium]